MTMTAGSNPSTASVLRGGLLGGVATASGIALTATSGWLIVRAAERPVILTLLTAIVMVRAFGIARPVFRYWERLVSHDAALGLLAQRRTEAYRALIPLTPARLGTRRRSAVLTGVVDDLTDEVEATVRVTVPVIGAVLAGALVVALSAALEPAVGAVLAVLALVVALICLVAARLETRSLDELFVARDEVARVAALATSQADQLQAVGGWTTALRWLDDAHAGLARATRRVSLGRASAAAGFLIAVGTAVVTIAFLVRDLDAGGPVKALLTLTPVAVSEAIAPLVDAVRARTRAAAAAARTRALLGLQPAGCRKRASGLRRGGGEGALSGIRPHPLTGFDRLERGDGARRRSQCRTRHRTARRDRLVERSALAPRADRPAPTGREPGGDHRAQRRR